MLGPVHMLVYDTLHVKICWLYPHKGIALYVNFNV